MCQRLTVRAARRSAITPVFDQLDSRCPLLRRTLSLSSTAAAVPQQLPMLRLAGCSRRRGEGSAALARGAVGGGAATLQQQAVIAGWGRATGRLQTTRRC